VVQDLHAGTTLVGGSGPLPIQKVSPLDTVPVVLSLTNVYIIKKDVPSKDIVEFQMTGRYCLQRLASQLKWNNKILQKVRSPPPGEEQYEEEGSNGIEGPTQLIQTTGPHPHQPRT
jgi:hypothetical protein